MNSINYYKTKLTEYTDAKRHLVEEFGNNISNNVSQVYEDSLLASTDAKILDDLKNISITESTLNTYVNVTKNKCSALGYDNTVNKFGEIYKKASIFANTYQVIHENVSNSSKEAYNELTENYNKEFSNYEMYCRTADSLLYKLGNLIENYDNNKAEIESLKSEAMYNDLTDEVRSRKNERRRKLVTKNENNLASMASYDTNLDQILNTDLKKCIEINMNELLEKGLKKVPLTTSSSGDLSASAGILSYQRAYEVPY